MSLRRVGFRSPAAGRGVGTKEGHTFLGVQAGARPCALTATQITLLLGVLAVGGDSCRCWWCHVADKTIRDHLLMLQVWPVQVGIDPCRNVLLELVHGFGF